MDSTRGPVCIAKQIGKPDACNFLSQPVPTPRNALAWTIFNMTRWQDGQFCSADAAALARDIGRCDGPILLDHVERMDTLARETRRLVDLTKPALPVAPPLGANR